MSGNYPDLPAYRMRYDRDGTQAFVMTVGSTTPSQLSQANMVTLNNESTDELGSYSGHTYMIFIFPELRDFDGYHVQIGGYEGSYRFPSTLEVSSNTTNGYDGTWTTLQSTWVNGNTIPGYRNAIQLVTALGVRAVRFRENMSGGAITTTVWRTIHLYGEAVPTTTEDRLEFWHPTLDQRVDPNHFEWGDRARGTSGDKTFRVKNLSDTHRAVSVRVAMDALTDSSPSLPGLHQLSTDGSTFAAQITLPTLEPGAISGVLTVRQTLPTNAQLSLWNAWLFAEAASWEAI